HLAVQPAEGVVGVEQADAVAQVEDQAAAGAGLGGADVLLGAAQRAPAGGGVVGVDAAAEDVDPQQAARGRVPGGALAQGGLRADGDLVCGGAGCGAHAALRWPRRSDRSAAPLAASCSSSARRSSLQRLIGTEMDSAATTSPVRPRTGAATQETSGLDSR